MNEDELDRNVVIAEKEIIEIKKRLLESLENYRKTVDYMLGDAPIGVLCLPKAIETLLNNAGCYRIYDLFDRDLTEIKGLGDSRLRHLTSCLNQFLSIS